MKCHYPIPVFIIANLGLTHNGNIEIAKQLIDSAKEVGANAVSFIIQNIENSNSKNIDDKQLLLRNREKELSFSFKDFELINEFCIEKGIHWIGSALDIESQKLLQRFDLKYNQVNFAVLGNEPLLNLIASERKMTFISMGLNELSSIDRCVQIFRRSMCPFELLYCGINDRFEEEEANLYRIVALKERYNCKVGYSSFEKGMVISIAAVALRISSLERYMSLENEIQGGRYSFSINSEEFKILMNSVNCVQKALGSGNLD
jgi:N-acetylneuraminate synthase